MYCRYRHYKIGVSEGLCICYSVRNCGTFEFTVDGITKRVYLVNRCVYKNKNLIILHRVDSDTTDVNVMYINKVYKQYAVFIVLL